MIFHQFSLTNSGIISYQFPLLFFQGIPGFWREEQPVLPRTPGILRDPGLESPWFCGFPASSGSFPGVSSSIIYGKAPVSASSFSILKIHPGGNGPGFFRGVLILNPAWKIPSQSFLPPLSQFPELGTILGSFQSLPVEFPAESNLGFLIHFPGIPGNSQPFPVLLGCIPPSRGFIFPRFGKRRSQNLLPAPAWGSSPIWNSQLILGSALEHSPNPRGALG